MVPIISAIQQIELATAHCEQFISAATQNVVAVMFCLAQNRWKKMWVVI